MSADSDDILKAAALVVVPAFIISLLPTKELRIISFVGVGIFYLVAFRSADSTSKSYVAWTIGMMVAILFVAGGIRSCAKSSNASGDCYQTGRYDEQTTCD